MIDTAKQIAYISHAGQTRRDGRTPYLNHVADVVRRLEGERATVIATAWLHDTIEDTDLTLAELDKAGVPICVVESVKLLTRGKESYYSYLARIKENPIARKVKIADMQSNLADDPTEKQVIRYTSGLAYLQAE